MDDANPKVHYLRAELYPWSGPDVKKLVENLNEVLSRVSREELRLRLAKHMGTPESHLFVSDRELVHQVQENPQIFFPEINLPQ